MVDRASAGRAVAHFARLLLGQRDELVERAGRYVGIGGHDGRQTDQGGHRCEVLDRVVAEIWIERRVDGHIAGIAEHHHVPVGRRLGHDAARMPPAPGMFSTMNGLPNLLLSFSASRRASTSGLPPGPEGAISRTVWVGHASSWAIAAGESIASSSARTGNLRCMVMVLKRRPKGRVQPRPPGAA